MSTQESKRHKEKTGCSDSVVLYMIEVPVKWKETGFKSRIGFLCKYWLSLLVDCKLQNWRVEVTLCRLHRSLGSQDTSACLKAAYLHEC